MSETQNSIVLAHLKKGALTPLAALREYGIFRLGARIWDLRQAGHEIDREMVAQGKKHFAKYRLVKAA